MIWSTLSFFFPPQLSKYSFCVTEDVCALQAIQMTAFILDQA